MRKLVVLLSIAGLLACQSQSSQPEPAAADVAKAAQGPAVFGPVDRQASTLASTYFAITLECHRAVGGETRQFLEIGPTGGTLPPDAETYDCLMSDGQKMAIAIKDGMVIAGRAEERRKPGSETAP